MCESGCGEPNNNATSLGRPVIIGMAITFLHAPAVLRAAGASVHAHLPGRPGRGCSDDPHTK